MANSSSNSPVKPSISVSEISSNILKELATVQKVLINCQAKAYKIELQMEEQKRELQQMTLELNDISEKVVIAVGRGGNEKKGAKKM